MAEEIVIFEKDAKKNLSDKNKDLKQKIAEGKKEGIAEGAKEAAKQQEQAKEVTPQDLQQQGKNEGIKEGEKEAGKNQHVAEEKLDNLVQKIKHPLLKIQTTGFLNFKPDILTIDPLKVSIIYRFLFGAEQKRSIFIKDIADIFVESIPFATAIRIIDNLDKENPLIAKPFKKADAEKAKDIILGLIAASKEDIEISSLEGKETAEKIAALGQTPST